MRRVSKLYYYLSQTPAVWKRLLKSIDYPLPPVPPTSRHSYAKLSGLEVERLLTRPLSLNYAWQAKEPGCYDEWQFNAHHRVKSMVILPGGHYLVASVSDYGDQYHAVMLWMLDHTYAPAVPLAKTPVSTKAYNLQARYMTVGGRRGITISFVCRGFKHRSDAKKGIDLSQYSGDYDVDPPFPLVYECTVLHAALDSLESVGDPRLIPGSQAFIDHARSQPPPFRRIAVIKSTRCLGPATMDEIWGSPYLAIVRRPNTIMFKNLDGGAISTLTPTPTIPELAQFDHHIMALRLLPVQNQILVVRKIQDTSPPILNQDVFQIEFYDVPVNLSGQPLDVSAHPVDILSMQTEILHEVNITDHYIPSRNDESLNKQVFGSDTKPPHPISIISRGTDKMVEHPFPPTPPTSTSARDPLTPRSLSPFSTKQEVQYKYTFEETYVLISVHAPVDSVYRVLPGSYRPIFYSIPKDDRTDSPPVLSMKRYWDDSAEWLKQPSAEQLADPLYLSVDGHKLRDIGFFGEKDTTRVTAMAWDETIGRLCMVPAGRNTVVVLDFAKAPKEDHLGRR
ncbi:hypothetical protein NLI96_g8515 [Meripilus lineatus]|uniref:Uncharacterized protein n=1 Tax=Meripilus lineatus TaxID=2056292 RepID=A0AAD5UX53_9APHY|nr:hypothetical protein NLI96_g8515 [Physisporinus lineatus]